MNNRYESVGEQILFTLILLNLDCSQLIMAQEINHPGIKLKHIEKADKQALDKPQYFSPVEQKCFLKMTRKFSKWLMKAQARVAFNLRVR